MKNGTGDWTNIGVFLAVFRSGSTLAASRELGLSQVTVARRLDALEAALGLQLFQRDTRGAHPTEDARRLVAAAERMAEAAEEFRARAEARRRETGETIRIAAPSPNFTKAFSAILAEHTKAHPNVEFILLPSDQPVDAGAGEADISILYTRSIDNQTVICRKVGVEQTTLYASREYVALNGLPRSADDLRGQLVIGVQGDKLPLMIADWISARVQPEMVATRCENIASLVAAIQMGKGIGPMPLTLGDGVEGCERCFDPPEELDLPIWMVINPVSYKRQAVREFAGFFGPRFAALLRGRPEP